MGRRTFVKNVKPGGSSSLVRGTKSANEKGMKKLVLLAFALALSACATMVPRADPGSPSSRAPVDPQRLSDWTRQISADDLQGRAPGTEGETRTIAWLTEQFRALGLEPGGENGGWTQRVPLIRTQVPAQANFTIASHGESMALHSPRDL